MREMKKKDKIKKTAIFTIILVSCFLEVATKTVKMDGGKATNLKQVVDYKNWIKVNSAEPHRQMARPARLCNIPLEEEATELESEHKDKYITVYVNKIGKEAMFNNRLNFPIGSIIVKEKFLTKTSTSPELLTVMVKQPKGFNSQCGDWEFLVLDGDVREIKASGKLEKCQSCHLKIEYQDFVFRTYLPRNLTYPR